jgi:hypothetical protein
MDGTGYATVSACGGSTSAPPAQWIWSATCSVAWQTHTFAKDFSVSGLLTAATLDLTIDNWASITINGDPVAWPYSSNQYEAYATLTPFDVTGKIRSGSNTISIYAEDYGGGSGVLARLTMTGVPGFTIDNTAPVVGEVQRQLIAETSSTWNAPRYTVTATDSVGIATVMLQTATSSNGPWTDSGTAVTQPFSGSIYVVSGPTISGTTWVRMRVKDAAGNESMTDSVLVTVWNASSGNAEWTTGGSAYFSDDWLVLTPSLGGPKGGGYFEPLVPTRGQVSVSFDLEVNGGADGMCSPRSRGASAAPGSNKNGGAAHAHASQRAADGRFEKVHCAHVHCLDLAGA